MLTTEEQAPDFALEDQDGNRVTLSQFAGRDVVLYFYPKDLGSRCSVGAAAFSAVVPELQEMNAVLLGVNRDGRETHQDFIKKFKLAFPLLSDPEGKCIDAYGAYKKAPLTGKPSKGTDWTTVWIGPDGIVREIWVKYNLLNHPGDVVDAIQKSHR